MHKLFYFFLHFIKLYELKEGKMYRKGYEYKHYLDSAGTPMQQLLLLRRIYRYQQFHISHNKIILKDQN